MMLKKFLQQEGVKYSTYNYWRTRVESDSDNQPSQLVPITFTERKRPKLREGVLAG